MAGGPATVAANVLQHGTGALNIDGCRIEGAPEAPGTTPPTANGNGQTHGAMTRAAYATPAGRWPANVILSHSPGCREVGTRKVRNGGGVPLAHSVKAGTPAFTSTTETSTVHHFGADGTETVTAWECVEDCAVRLLDEQTGELTSGRLQTHHKRSGSSRIGTFEIRERTGEACDWGGDSGGASRFFYCPKADSAERHAGLSVTSLFTPAGSPERNDHPTVKPIALMRWLVRLVTPAGGTVLDPFCGSGTTGCAAVLEGFDFIGIEREAQYLAIARARIAHFGAMEDARP